MSRTVIIYKNGKEHNRLPQVEVKQDGTLWYQGKQPIVNSNASLSEDELKKLVESKNYEAIPQECLCKLGENLGGVVIKTRDEVEREENTNRAATLFTRDLDCAKNGALFLLADVRDTIGNTVAWNGVEFEITGTGKEYKVGLWTVKRHYVDVKDTSSITAEQYNKLVTLANELKSAFYRKFDKSFDDENGCCNRPTDNSHAVFAMLDRCPHDVKELAKTLRDIEHDISRKASGGVCWYAGEYAEKAKSAYQSGERNPAVLRAILAECNTDKDYIEAMLSM